MTSSDCPKCRGVGWVCENHRHKPWDASLPDGCECGAGAPCPLCNEMSRDDLPDLGQVMTVDEVAMQRAKRARKQ